MKHLRNIILSTVSAGLVVSLAGCTNSYEDYNQDPYGVSKKETERDAYSLGAAMVNLQSWVIPTDVNTNQFTECLCGGSYGGYLSDSNAGFAGKNFAGVPITESGILAAAHLLGASSVKTFFKSEGKASLADANGTSIINYMKSFQHFDLSNIKASKYDGRKLI